MKINPLNYNTARLPQKMFLELNFFHSYAKLYTIQCVNNCYTQSCLVLNMVWLTSDSTKTATWKLWKHSCDCCHYRVCKLYTILSHTEYGMSLWLTSDSMRLWQLALESCENIAVIAAIIVMSWTHLPSMAAIQDPYVMSQPFLLFMGKEWTNMTAPSGQGAQIESKQGLPPWTAKYPPPPKCLDTVLSLRFVPRYYTVTLSLIQMGAYILYCHSYSDGCLYTVLSLLSLI